MTCARCGEVASQVLCNVDLCQACWDAARAPLLARFGGCRLYRIGEQLVLEVPTRAVQFGRARPEYGADQFEVGCPVCAATWVGRVGDPCGWCADADARQRRYQMELTLTPPEVDPRLDAYEGAMAEWARRLARAVEVGLIDAGAARAAWVSGVSRTVMLDAAA